MKLTTCLIMISVCATQGQYLSEEQRTKLRTITTQCIQDTGVDNNLVLQMRKGVFENDQKLKDFLFCTLKNSDFQNTEGALQEDVIRNHFSFEPRAVQAFVPCFGQTGEDGPETAYKAYKCFRNNLPEDLKLIL